MERKYRRLRCGVYFREIGIAIDLDLAVAGGKASDPALRLLFSTGISFRLISIRLVINKVQISYAATVKSI